VPRADHHALAVPSYARSLAAFGLTLCVACGASAGYTDGQGREWLQVKSFTGKTWNQIDALCPNDGVTPCVGTLSGVDITGYVWATQDQVLSLFAESLPEIAESGFVGGPEYVLAGLGFFGLFQPTFEFYTTFGGYNYLSGWTATSANGVAIVPEVSAEYPVFYGAFNTLAEVPVTSASQFRGAWFFKPAPTVCSADLDASGVVDAADLAILLGAWGTSAGSSGDLDGDGAVAGADLAILLGAWGTCR
jgi:hypothetical protein